MGGEVGDEMGGEVGGEMVGEIPAPHAKSVPGVDCWKAVRVWQVTFG